MWVIIYVLPNIFIVTKGVMIHMSKFRKLTRLTAGLLSLALAFGAFALPQAGSSPKLISAAADQDETTMYEYTIKGLQLIAKKNLYFFAYCPENGRSLEFTVSQKSDSKRIEISNMIQKIDYEDKFDIKFRSYNYYGELERSFEMDTLSFSYIVEDIVYIRDSGIQIYGDINGDETVDTYDIITFRKYLTADSFDGLAEDQIANADINKNGSIDAEDLQKVIDFTLGRSTGIDEYAQVGSLRLDNTVDVQASEGTATDQKFASAEMNLGIELLKKCYDPEKEPNTLISPFSISSALAMTANGADNKTREEMERVLGNGLTLDELNEYMAYYVANLPDEKKEKLYSANSIWYRDVPNLKILDDFLIANKKYYSSEIYQDPFDYSVADEVNKWVNKNTRGMIPSVIKKDDITPDLMMILVNTLYFEAEWAAKYEMSVSEKFTDLNGEKHDIQAMHSAEYMYYDLGDADAFRKRYKGNYSFVGILPHENVDFNEYIAGLDSDKLLSGLKNYEDPDNYDLYVMIPKFSYDYGTLLNDQLKKLGMEKAFDPYAADFSKMNDLTVEGADPLYISKVIHKTRIEVTESGTKAAAVTAVMQNAGCGIPPEPKKEIYIYLNRPFVYMIVDDNNVPVFIGAATSLES